MILDFLFINKLFSSFFSFCVFFSLLIKKVEKKYKDIIGPKER